MNSNTKRKDPRAGKPLSEARKLELQAQRKAKLGDQTPNQYAKERDYKLLRWVWKWGYSSKVILQTLSESSRHGIVNRLVKNGLLAETKTETGAPVMSFFTLTEKGLAEVERQADRLHFYPYLDPYKVRQNTLRHDLMAQSYTVKNGIAGQIKKYDTPLTMRGMSARNVKEPDCAWEMTNDEVIAIEIELTKKWDRDFDDFRLKVVNALDSNSRYTKFYLVTDSKAIAKAYKEGMKPGTRVPIWEKNAQGKWNTYDYFEIPKEIGYGPTGLFQTYLVESK
jgi:DNA-binding PadR family transcriptional regulator